MTENSTDYWHNIEGSLGKYRDVRSTRTWLSRAHRALNPDEFTELIGQLEEWTTKTADISGLEEDVLILIAEFCPDGDEIRRARFAEYKKQRTEQETELRAAQQKELRLTELRRVEELRLAEVQRLESIDHERKQAETRQREAALQAEVRQRADKKAAIVQDLQGRLAADFLSSDAYFTEVASDLVSPNEFNALKHDFVRNWIMKQGGDKASNFSPDNDQIAAIAAVHGHVHVVARAGSGKTQTLVNRAHFLIRHCGVAPKEILLLAFNRKAAMEIQARLRALLQQGASVGQELGAGLPHVMTFHALGRALVFTDRCSRGTPAPDLLVDGESDQTQSKVLQQVIDDLLLDPVGQAQIRALMLAHFREDWERIIAGSHDCPPAEFLRIRRALPHVALNGDYLKSRGEKLIADFLFEHDIPYSYERNHWWDGINYRPDFTLFLAGETGAVIEYFGLQGDPDYDQMTTEKRVYWREKSGWTLIEITPREIGESRSGGFREALCAQLRARGFACERLSEDEIWDRARKRAIDQFTKAVRTFVGRCRKQMIEPGKLRHMIDAFTPLSDVERQFHEVAHQVYLAYLERLDETGAEDFDGLLKCASDLIERGSTGFTRKEGKGDLGELRFVCIDEYQDFSELFHRLIKATRSVNPEVQLFCVGDDWQAINGFAGSDLKFFEQFQHFVGPSTRLDIRTNYRSAGAIVAASNALMNGLGNEAIAGHPFEGDIFVADLAGFELTQIEKSRHPGDVITPAVVRLVHNALRRDMPVVLVCQRNTLPWFVRFEGKGGNQIDDFLEIIRSHFPLELRERITISTVHKFKGMEKPCVIVLDAILRSYPLLHPDWVLSRILGDSLLKIKEEQRRLFYVAVTRAAKMLVIITEGGQKSPFLEDMERDLAIPAISWPEWPTVAGPIPQLVIKIGNRDGFGNQPTLRIKDQLKACRYQWSSTGWKAWARCVPSETFSIEQIKKEAWASNATGIEIRIFDEADHLLESHILENGSWRDTRDESALPVSRSQPKL